MTSPVPGGHKVQGEHGAGRGAAAPRHAEFDPHNRALLPDLLMLVRAAAVSPERIRLGLVVLGLVVVVSATAFAQIRLNAWNQPFYDALADRNLRAFGQQLLVFAQIAGALLCLNVGQMWLQEMLKLTLRAQATRDLLDQWLKPARAFRLGLQGDIGVNPDQRMHEDARHLTELSSELGIGLFQATLLLGSFIGVLWLLSQDVTLSIAGHVFAIPGYMVWCAFIYAGTASLLSWRLGRPLISLNAERYAREADLRYAMVRANQHTDAIALYRGEAAERKRLDGPLHRVLAAMRNIVNAVVPLTAVNAGYGWGAIVAPIIIAAPAYFDGRLSFGTMMVAVGAFNQVQQALRWFVDNFTRIADWRATLLRVVAFRDALMTMDEDSISPEHRIDYREGETDALVLDHLEIILPDHRTRLAEPIVSITPGRHVQIVGEAGSGKTTLFRAIAGIWACGRGTIRVPARAEMAFLPQNPYLPPGTLRTAMSYPFPSQTFDNSRVVDVMRSLDLSHRIGDLDRLETWDKELTIDEQQLLALARVVLQKPGFIVLDEALEALDDEHRHLAFAVIAQELPHTAFLAITRRKNGNGFYEETVELVREDLAPGEEPGPVPPHTTPEPPPHAPVPHAQDSHAHAPRAAAIARRLRRHASTHS